MALIHFINDPLISLSHVRLAAEKGREVRELGKRQETIGRLIHKLRI
jgi:hypothetical protein